MTRERIITSIISYDKEADCAYIALSERVPGTTYSARHERDHVLLDFDKETGELVGIELLRPWEWGIGKRRRQAAAEAWLD